MFALRTDYHSGTKVQTDKGFLSGRTFFRASDSNCSDMKTKLVAAKPHQPATAVLTSFSKFVKGFPIYATFKNTKTFQWEIA